MACPAGRDSRNRFVGKLCRLLVALVAVLPAPGALADGPARVLALGGSVTEIVYALGQQDRLVARDTTSTFPPEAEALPDVGYLRALSPEGVLSVAPDLVLALEGSGPPETMQVLRAAGLEIVTIPEGYDAAAVARKIKSVAEALGVPERGALLAAQVEDSLAQAAAAARTETPPKVLFVLPLHGGRIMASGSGTAADSIIRLAGGVNAMEGFEGYRQVGDEAVLNADPDVILMMERAPGHSVSDADLRAHPILGKTRAGAAGNVVRLPGLLLLGFGPRTTQAIDALSRAFRHAEARSQ